MHDGHGDGHALRLADAHLPRIAPHELAIGRQSHVRQQFEDGLPGLPPRGVAMGAPDLAELRFEAQGRVERGHGTLEHQCDFLAADAAELAARRRQ